MTIPEITLTTDDAGREQRPAGPARADTWKISGAGLGTVIRLELRQRVRSTRWVLALVIWTAVIGVLTGLSWYAFQHGYTPDTETAAERAAREAEAGRSMFAVVVFLLLGLGGLVAPALSATTINGDRANGVLAILQTTLLTPAELVLGKLVAAWTTSLALLVTATPFILWAYSTGGTSFGRLLVTLAVLVLMLLVVCAVGLGWSAVTARTTSSAVLTYLSVALLGLGLPLIFALTLSITTRNENVRVYEKVESASTTDAKGESVDNYSCRWTTTEMTRSHTEYTWWLLAPNPFVIISDAAPSARPSAEGSYDSDPFTSIRREVREARLGPPDVQNWCGEDDAHLKAYNAERRLSASELGPVWPFGLLIDLGVAAGFTVMAVRRLRAPSRTLLRGVRVA